MISPDHTTLTSALAAAIARGQIVIIQSPATSTVGFEYDLLDCYEPDPIRSDYQCMRDDWRWQARRHDYHQRKWGTDKPRRR